MTVEGIRDTLLKLWRVAKGDRETSKKRLDADIAYWLDSLGERGKEKALLRHYLIFTVMFKGVVRGTRERVQFFGSITDTMASAIPVTGEFRRNSVLGSGEETLLNNFKKNLENELQYAEKEGLPGDKSLLARCVTVFCIKVLLKKANNEAIPEQAQSFRLTARQLLHFGAGESSKISGIVVDEEFVNSISRAILSSGARDMNDDLNKFLNSPLTRE